LSQLKLARDSSNIRLFRALQKAFSTFPLSVAFARVTLEGLAIADESSGAGALGNSGLSLFDSFLASTGLLYSLSLSCACIGVLLVGLTFAHWSVDRRAYFLHFCARFRAGSAKALSDTLVAVSLFRFAITDGFVNFSASLARSNGLQHFLDNTTVGLEEFTLLDEDMNSATRTGCKPAAVVADLNPLLSLEVHFVDASNFAIIKAFDSNNVERAVTTSSDFFSEAWVFDPLSALPSPDLPHHVDNPRVTCVVNSDPHGFSWESFPSEGGVIELVNTFAVVRSKFSSESEDARSDRVLLDSDSAHFSRNQSQRSTDSSVELVSIVYDPGVAVVVNIHLHGSKLCPGPLSFVG